MTGTFTIEISAHCADDTAWTDGTDLIAPTVDTPLNPDTKMRQLVEKLAAFNTKEKIAQFFYNEGVRGQRGNYRDCPVAKWLAVETGAKYLVGGAITTLGAPKGGIPTPQVVREFIGAFDRGEFPELATGVMHCGCPLCANAPMWANTGAKA